MNRIKLFFYGVILPAALSGTVAVLCWLLLKKLCGTRFSAAFYKGALAAAALCFLVPWTVLQPARPGPAAEPGTTVRTAAARQVFTAPSSPVKEALEEAMKEPEAESAQKPGGAALEAVVYVWALGAAGLLIYRTVCYKIFLRRLKRYRVFAEEETAELAIGGVKVYRCAAVFGAMTVGFWRHEVYLPPSGPEGRGLKYVLMHEGAHIGGRDTLLKLAMECLCAVYWFCPFIWIMKYLFARECEYAADACVARRLNAAERKEYGFVLLSAIEERRRNAPPFCATGFSVNGKKFQERIECMMRTGKMTVKAKIAAVFCALLLLSAGALAGCASAPAGSGPEGNVTT
ncbi:MAG: M56 family metallopeptidase, partial [Oscillospiraceae bacterium]|nr:M56 family metallopeptidase [Oscillospiraceae bacterium]